MWDAFCTASWLDNL